MGSQERARWNERYASGEYRPQRAASSLVEEAIARVGGGRALVLACGSGRNALRLAESGFEVTAVDISPVAIDMARVESEVRGLVIEWRVADIDDLELPQAVFDLITMIRYVNRAVWPRLVDWLSVDGWLLMEQHLRTHRVVIGPSDHYRVGPGELLTAFSDLRVITYTESIEPTGATSPGLAATARLLACKGDPGW